MAFPALVFLGSIGTSITYLYWSSHLNALYSTPAVAIFGIPYWTLSLLFNIRHNTGIYLRVMGTCHFGKRAYPDPWVFSPAGIIGGDPGEKHCLPPEYPAL